VNPRFAHIERARTSCPRTPGLEVRIRAAGGKLVVRMTPPAGPPSPKASVLSRARAADRARGAAEAHARGQRVRIEMKLATAVPGISVVEGSGGFPDAGGPASRARRSGQAPTSSAAIAPVAAGTTGNTQGGEA
jgi:hypothetical protein